MAINIDRLARKAEQSARRKPLQPGDVPVNPVGWMLIVEPLEAKAISEGGLYIADQAQEVEEIQQTVGRILKMGNLCYSGTTESGVCLADVSPKPAVGDFVLFQRYTGQKIKLRRKDEDDRLVIMLQDSEILGLVLDPDQIRHWL